MYDQWIVQVVGARGEMKRGKLARNDMIGDMYTRSGESGRTNMASEALNLTRNVCLGLGSKQKDTFGNK